MPRTRFVALVGLLALAGCTSSEPGTPAPVEGALLQLAQDVDLGITDDGGGGGVVLALVDAAGSPVLLTTPAFADPPQLTRGPDPAAAVPIAALGTFGAVTDAAVTGDGTVVLLGQAAPGDDAPTASVVRIAPNGSETALPFTGDTGDIEPTSLVITGQGDLSPSGDRAVLAAPLTDSSQGFPVSTGVLQVVEVDTTTGAVLAATELSLAAARGDVPGQARALRLDDVTIADDGSIAVLVTTSEQQTSSRLVRLDAALAPAGPDVPLPVLPEYRGFVALVPDGTAYLTSPTEDVVRLLRVGAGAAEPSTVAEVGQAPSVAGLAVDPERGWAYLTGTLDLDRGELLLAVDLATGAVPPGTPLCGEGFIGEPRLGPGGTTLAVPGECSDVVANAEHLYLLI